MNAQAKPRIIYPSAEELDTGAYPVHCGDKWTLYLIPAEETLGGIPEVEVFHGIGGSGTPGMLYHGRSCCLGNYGPGIVGRTVLECLRQKEDFFLELSAEYRGSEWDGSNHRGSWEGPRREDVQRPDFEVIDRDREDLHYWEASDWYENSEWEGLARGAKIDPERALVDFEEAVKAVLVSEESAVSAYVRGLEDKIRQMAESWVEEKTTEG